MKREGGQVQLKGRMLDRHVEIREAVEGSVRDAFNLAGAGATTADDIDTEGLTEVTIYAVMDAAGAVGDLTVGVNLYRLKADGTYAQMLDTVTPYIDNPAAVLFAGKVYKVARLRTGGAAKINVSLTNNNAAAKVVHLSYSGVA